MHPRVYGGTDDPPERDDDQKINEDLRAGEEVRKAS
jgi:hypothetical protein